MKYIRLLAYIFIVVLLAACAPSVKGSSSLNPYDLDAFDTIRVGAGETSYASEVFSFRSFDFDNSDFATAVTRSPSVGQRLIASARGKLTLTDISVPQGWSLSLADAEAVKVVTKVDSKYVYYNYTIEAIAAIKAPMDVEPGTYRLTSTLRASTGRTQDFPLTVTVIEPSPEE